MRPARPGGALRIVADDGHFEVARHADDANDAAVVRDDRHVAHDEHALAALLGQVDEPTFNNVFAVGLREIQELGTLGDTQAADELYSLALGLDRVSLADVLAELEASRNRLLAPDERPSLVTQLVSQRQRLTAEVQELGQSAGRYATLSAAREQLDADFAELEASTARLEKQARELALARALAPRWQRRQAIDEQLQTLGGLGVLPEGALARFERLNARLAVRRRRHRQLQKKRRRLRREIEALAINEPLVRGARGLKPWPSSSRGSNRSNAVWPSSTLSWPPWAANRARANRRPAATRVAPNRSPSAASPSSPRRQAVLQRPPRAPGVSRPAHLESRCHRQARSADRRRTWIGERQGAHPGVDRSRRTGHPPAPPRAA